MLTSFSENIELKPEHQSLTNIEWLVSEANHRVANSFSLLAATVTNEAEQLSRRPQPLTNAEVGDIMRQVAARIATIGQMHRELARHPGEDWVDLNAHLRQLCGNLIETLAPGRFTLRHTTTEPCRLASAKLLHLCLIATEIVTNSIKYAHPTGICGIVTLSCWQEDDGRIVVDIGDDGVGLPDDFNAEVDGGLGTRTVCALARGLGAELSKVGLGLGLRVRLVLPAMAA